MNYEIYNGTTRWSESEMAICPEHLKHGVSVVHKDGECPLCVAESTIETLRECNLELSQEVLSLTQELDAMRVVISRMERGR